MKEISDKKLAGAYNANNDEESSLEIDSEGKMTKQLSSLRFISGISNKKVSIFGITLLLAMAFLIISCISLSHSMKVLVANNEYQDSITKSLNISLAAIAEKQTLLSLEQQEILKSAKTSEANSLTQVAGQQQISMTLHAVLQNTAKEDAQAQKPKDSKAPSLGSDPTCPEVDFYKIALKYGTDKVTTHSYDHIYAKYFAPVRCKPLKILEIGLGCDMGYGPGASYYLWLDYFPNAEIYFIEYDEACAKAWQKLDSRVKVFAGDQADVAFLKEFLTKSGGDFDFIIDDGGHTMNQQIVSFENLFYSVKIGGVYFIEDLLTSWFQSYGGGEGVEGTTLNYIKDIISDLTLRRNIREIPIKREISKSIYSADCMDEVCGFVRQ